MIGIENSKIIDILINNGADVYIVGGFLRNYYLNYPVNDLDLEVYHCDFEIIKDLLKEYDCYINDKFKTIKINDLEIAIPRIETKVGHGYDEYLLDFDINLPLEKAITRRDFTINALMYCLNNNELIDLCHGLADIKTKTLRMVNPNTYAEDSIRVLRLLKYQTLYNLNIDKNTLEKSVAMALYLWKQPLTLVYQYFKKIIHPHLDVFLFFDVLQLFLLRQPLTEKISNSIYHPEKQLLKHVIGSCFCLRYFPSLSQKDYYLLFVVMLFHDYGKLLGSEGHEQFSLEFFDYYHGFFIQKDKDLKLVKELINDHMIVREYAEANEIEKMKELKNKYGNQFYLLEIVGTCDYAGRVIDFNEQEFLKRIATYQEKIIEMYRMI